MAGSGTQTEQLKACAASNPRIKFLGARPQRVLGALYYHALASIIPSITYETFGMINIESFARKTPVIVRDLGALPEVVKDSKGGFVFRTEADLLDAVRKIIASPDLRDELGENGYRAFLTWWTREAHLERYFGYLESAALRKHGRVPWEAGD